MKAPRHVVIRAASVEDTPAIAYLRGKVWRETYRQIAPADVQAALDEKHREAGWRTRLSAPSPGQAIFVAELDGRVVSVVAAGGPSSLIFGDRGEISALDVDGAIQRKGSGRALLAAAVRHMRPRDLPVSGSASSLATSGRSVSIQT